MDLALAPLGSPSSGRAEEWSGFKEGRSYQVFIFFFFFNVYACVVFKTCTVTFELSDIGNIKESNCSFKASPVKLLLFLNLLSEVSKILQ